MPYITQEFHGRWHERIVLGELELGGENAAFEGSVLWSFDQCLPDVHVVFADGTSGDAIRWVVGEVFVFLEEAFACYGGHGELLAHDQKWEMMKVCGRWSQTSIVLLQWVRDVFADVV